MNLKHPVYLGEKIQWLKMNGNMEELSIYVDKYEVEKSILRRPFVKGHYSIEQMCIMCFAGCGSCGRPHPERQKMKTGEGYDAVV